MQNALIEARGLTKTFISSHAKTVDALYGIDLTIPRGSIYGLIGTSGAGKSTLLRCLAGLDTPTKGSLRFDGEMWPAADRATVQQQRQQIGLVFQHFHLFSARTVAENVAYPLEISGIPLKERQARVAFLLEAVGLANKVHCYPAQLSGGEKQRVGIARALANSPRLLLCDEPTSALDATTSRSLLELLQNLHQQMDLTIVIITHQLEVVKQICQRVAVLSHGRVIEEGEVRHVLTHPAHSVTRRLLHLEADQLPEELLQARSPGKTLMRLKFQGQKTKEPLLSQVIKAHDIDISILSGGIDYLKGLLVGHLLVEFSGSATGIAGALSDLESQHVICEVIE